MKKYLKAFFYRGLMFGGFGPITAGIIYLIIEKTTANFSLTGKEVCLAVLSTYLLAFLQAGASVFNQIDEWSLPKSLLCHFATLYVAYVSCYLINTWIPFRSEVVLIFTAIFVVLYFLIWGIVYFSIKSTCKKFNKKLN